MDRFGKRKSLPVPSPEPQPPATVFPVAEETPALVKVEAKLDLPQHKPFYTLSERQADKLITATKAGNIAWQTPQLKPSDDAETKMDLTILNQEMADLEALGLAANVSIHFRENIEVFRQTYKRQVQYYSPTRLAFMMFRHSDRHAQA